MDPLDSTVRCGECGAEFEVSFLYCLQHGWPTCCGYTMTLARTEADVDAAVKAVTAPVNEIRDSAARHGIT